MSAYNIAMKLNDHPTIKYESLNWQLIKAIRSLTVSEKNERAFAAADFALRQKRLLLAEEHPNWSAETVDEAARRLVYGTTEEASSFHVF